MQVGTEGYFQVAYSPNAATIIAFVTLSPAAKLKREEIKNGVIPDLGNLCDVVWLEWVHQCQLADPPVDPAGLFYILRQRVSNEQTVEMADYFMRMRGIPATSDWPGLEYDNMESDDAKVMLYTPNGRKCYFLVIFWKSASVDTVTLRGERRHLAVG